MFLDLGGITIEDNVLIVPIVRLCSFSGLQGLKIPFSICSFTSEFISPGVMLRSITYPAPTQSKIIVKIRDKNSEVFPVNREFKN